MKAINRLPRYAAMLGTLGHEARLAVLRLLLAHHPAGLVPSEIQEKTGVPASTLSRHLDLLRRHGLVDRRREGKYLRYSIHEANLRELLGFLLEECCSACGTFRAPRP